MYVVSYYNTAMKISFIAATIYIIYLMKYKKPYCMVFYLFLLIIFKSYDRLGDDFPHILYLVPAAAILTLLIHTKFELFEMSWSFSIWLEALSILP